MAKSAPPLLAAGLLALALSGPAAAAQVMYSYDLATPITVKMTENGVTFMLDKGLMRVKVLRMVETLDIGAPTCARPRRASLAAAAWRRSSARTCTSMTFI